MAKTVISPKQFFFFRRRYKSLIIFVGILFIILFIQTSYLQVINGTKYEKLALNNKEQYIPIPAYRGEIYDRNYSPESETNFPLAINEEQIGVYILPVHLKIDEVRYSLSNLSRILNFDFETKFFEFKTRKNYLEPFLVEENVPVSNITKIGEKIQNFPGVYWEPIYYRSYPLKNFASHIIGFVGKISEEELKEKSNDPDYHLNSIVGKMGVEKYYDKFLKGKDGVLLRIVDAKNRIRESKVLQKPVPGNILVLTIDKNIQSILEKVMKGVKGAAIVMKPDTGEILGMVSKPDFDPNIFVGKRNIEEIIRLSNHPDKPFLNRAIQAIYPSGSIFKIVTATAGLEEEIIDTSTKYFCSGYFRFPNDERVFHCTGIHGWMNIFTGIEFSCNVFFFNLSYNLGSKKITEYAKYYGFGKQSLIDLPGEQEGFLPSHSWKKKVFGESWYDGDTINYGIGQGFLLVTVLQVADMINGIANGGIIYQPHLLKAFYSGETGECIYIKQRKLLYNIPAREENINIIKKGLKMVCEGGTARVAARFSKVSLAGKTSTAQNTFGAPHAWFSCYAPYSEKKDRITVTVFAENAGGGGEIAAPIAVAILNAIFYNDDPVETKKKIFAAVQKDQYIKFLYKMKQKGLLEENETPTDIQF